jgi:hypothetical protein
MRSSTFIVRKDVEQLMATTSYVKFRHDRYLFDVRYGTLPAFHQQFRLGISMIEQPGETDKEIYFTRSTGKPRTSLAQFNRLARVETYYFDEQDHEAALAMFEHDHLELNNRRYTSKSVYKYAPNPLSKRSKGEIELYDHSFSSLNRC